MKNTNIAYPLRELITVQQLNTIRAIARNLKLDAETECERLNNCQTDELNIKAASDFIRHLQILEYSRSNLSPF